MTKCNSYNGTGTTETKLEERFDELFVSTYKIWDCYNDKPAPKNVMEIKDFIKQEIALAVQQERERILQKAKDILDKEAEYYGTDKHGLSYEQLEYIIEAINQYHE